MQTNVGTVDRTLRILLGIALLGATLLDVIGPWGWVGIIPLLTGIFQFCPAYALFGIRTCRQGK